MNTPVEKQKDVPEKFVVVCKRDLERAIKDGVISVESGTALWRSWRDREKKVSNTSPFQNWKNLFSIQIMLTLISYLLVVTGSLSALIFSWSHIGLLGVVALSTFFIVILTVNSFRLHRSGRTWERDMNAISSVVIGALIVYVLGIYFDVDFVAPKPKVDVFGVVPADNSGQIMSLSLVITIGLFTFLKCFHSKYIRTLCLLSCLFFFDSVIWLTMNVALPASDNRVWSTGVTFLFFLLWVVTRGGPALGEKGLKNLKVQHILTTGLLLCLMYTLNGDINPLYFFLISAFTFAWGIREKIVVLKVFSIACMASSIVLGFWSSIGSASSTLLIFLSSAAVLAYAKNTIAVDRNIYSVLKKVKI